MLSTTPPPRWFAGALLTHRFNPELGVGCITSLDGRALIVEFPRAGTTLRIAANTDALLPVNLAAGRPVRIAATREETRITARLEDGTFSLANGQIVAAHALWPLELEGALLERLALGELDEVGDFETRLTILQLQAIREADGLGSFLGGRIRLFPHQLYVAERACAARPVRWLLADEVGLGKTIEAALILNRLVHTAQVDRCLVVAPGTLTVQWLGELWRKYHQVFTLLDADRLADVARDFGAGFNPFELHRRTVVSLELLMERPELTAQAVTAGIDLLVVDEAQRLKRPPGHPGDSAWRAVAPIAALGRHVLLLSATPLEDDAHGFFRLLQLLRPDEFPEDVGFEERLAAGTPLPACTSATRRVDIGGLPPRVGVRVDLPASPGAGIRLDVERTVRAMPAANAASRAEKVDRVRRALASGAALSAASGVDDALRKHARAMDEADPRVAWLVSQAARWQRAGEKTLVFVADRESLDMARAMLSHRAQLSTGAFHEGLTAARRDLEVARFREADGPSLLVSTECGGEGRNFEFCRRLVLFDVPWHPSVVEQRIGRLDRIGRRIPVEIVYFRPAAGLGLDVVRLFEALGLFREPLAGIEPQLAPVEGLLEAIAIDPDASLTDAGVDALVSGVHAARTRIREAAYHELHRDPYRPELAPGILARVPIDMEVRTQEAVLAASHALGFTVAHPPGRRVFSIEFGSGALVESLPGVPGGATFVGTFDREEAVANETLDFFASGHALVEGIFAHFEDSPVGRVARVRLAIGEDRGAGLVAIYKEGRAFEIVAFDAAGRARPGWAAAFRRRPLELRPVTGDRVSRGDWQTMVRALAAKLDRTRRLHAVAAVEVQPAATQRGSR